MREEPIQLSVIVPVYNAEKTLERCLNSILNQSYTGFELLLINDGSKDNSANICVRYAKMDERITVINKENGGVSSARNTGLDFAKGTYITFIDSDDKIECEYLERLMKFNGADLVLCSSITFPKNKKTIFEDAVYNSDYDIGTCLSKYIVAGFTYPWGKLYRKSIIKDQKLKFNSDLYIGEDTLFINQYLLHINSLKLTSYTGYIYTQGRKGQLSGKTITDKYLIDASACINASYTALENRFHIDLKFAKYDLIQFYLHRYISSLYNDRLVSMKIKLRNICEKAMVNEIFYENHGNRKGKVQRIFDFLARNKFYYPLAVFNRTVGRYFF
ncbi:glycosyltransferase family 2 protein [Sphingobacterium spiritivorum]|uniref:glycosyltransferase family 2 protein n=1 Tax=Sphingobacterium spiritivorum TaxID=258 RepID=UPI003DA1D7F2